MERDGLDELARALASWLEAADRHAGDPSAGRQALDDARRWLRAATRRRVNQDGTGRARGYSPRPTEA
jgi:hypothetical protein